MNVLKASAVAALTLAVLAAHLLAGPLFPPAGPIASTGKPLADVQPRIAVNVTNTPGDALSFFKITQPGSYYLTSNISVPAGKNGIHIIAENVSLDLGGFTITAPSGASAPTILVFGNWTTLTNGSSVGGSGISLGGFARVSGVNVSGSSAHGLSASYGSIVTDCTISGCELYGIYISNWESRLERCHVSYCGNGIGVGRSCHLIGCIASHNVHDGIQFAGAAQNCTAASNGGDGFNASYASTMSGCTSRENTSAGFLLSGASQAEDCTSQDNGAYGFTIGAACSLRSCTATLNAVSAARLTGADASITACTFQGVPSFPVISIDNVTGARIERNTLSRGTYAVSVNSSASGAFIASNQCTQNTSGAFSVITANHQVGPTVSGGGVIASNSPYANFVR